jgi:hypothetical protein
VAIDQYAEAALGNREFFLNRPYGIGEQFWRLVIPNYRKPERPAHIPGCCSGGVSEVLFSTTD